MRPQCDELWGELRCQLVRAHESAHAARRDETLISWKANVAPEFANVIKLDWAQDVDG